MVYEFEQFRLDAARRSLARGGREIALQPKVFDLLVYLVEHRERVVTKDELLEKLWPDVAVTDGSLKRAVSLARSALGGVEAIRTYPRSGYRFDAEVTVAPEPVPRGATPAEAALEGAARSGAARATATEGLAALAGSNDGEETARAQARAAFARRAHAEAVGLFARADADEGLEGRDLEAWAHALVCTGASTEAIAPLERAVAAFAARGDRQGAARAASWLAQIHLEQRELTVGQGWLRRAARYLPSEGTLPEHGRLTWLESYFALAEGQVERALERAERTLAIGRELSEPNLEVLGLMYRGLALIALGDVHRGLALHDEAAAAVLGEAIAPWVGAIVYCGLIFTCRHRGDWQRAGQWTERFNRWCAQSEIAAFPGTCRLHRAEVLQFRGELLEAERELLAVCHELSLLAPWAEGDAHRVLGDLHLGRGALEEAEARYRRAHELGWDPQPGLALLQAKRGRHAAALKGLRRALTDPSWANRQRRASFLTSMVTVALGAGELEVAREAIARLDAQPELWSTPAHEALVTEARAELARHEGDHDAAWRLARSAVQKWQAVASPLNLARARLRLAELFLAEGDRDAAELELAAAESCARKLEQGVMGVDLERVRRALGPVARRAE